jgi:hypothetical protein
MTISEAPGRIPSVGIATPEVPLPMSAPFGDWFTVAGEFQRELLDFVSRRLERDGRTMREAVSKRDWAEAWTVQTQWVEDMWRDYLDEAATIFDICTRARSQDASGTPAQS